MEKINVLEILREAMDLEREGMRFYHKAAKHAEDKRAKEVFKILADEEMMHFEELELVFDQFCEQDEWMVEKDLSEAEPVKELDTESVFNEDGMDQAMDDMAAIDLGIEAEKKSIDLYKTALSDCKLNEHEKGCKIFSWLIDFEKEHLKRLKSLRRDLSS